jgi:predicted ATPase
VPVTPLIGRAREVAERRDCLLRADVRLLTLVGAPGIGKTRLSLQAALELRSAFADDVCFVALAPVSDPSLVAATIAHALGGEETAGSSLFARLQTYLRHKHMLLLLDNFEQVAAAAPRIAELLAAAPRLKVLVTSRAALHLSAEHQFAVPPLALPDLSQLPPLETLAQVAAVQLFVQHARAVAHDFALTSANAAAVAEICQRLDGLPLAIELAAARSKLLAPTALLARLDRRLRLLISVVLDLPPRQQTLRSTLDWSYDLLDQRERRLFARLGVFVGGCTLEAADAICNVTNDLGMDVLDGLAALLDNSLLWQTEQADGMRRYGMLETIREYATERLELSGEAEVLRKRHGAYYLALAETAEPELRGPWRRAWMDRLEVEHDNVRVALGWALERGEVALGLQLAGALCEFWSRHGGGGRAEGRRWVEKLLMVSSTAAAATRAKALYRAAWLACSQADFTWAAALCQESLALCQDLGDKLGIAWSLFHLGNAARSFGDHATARAYGREHGVISRDGRMLGPRLYAHAAGVRGDGPERLCDDASSPRGGHGDLAGPGG